MGISRDEFDDLRAQVAAQKFMINAILIGLAERMYSPSPMLRFLWSPPSRALTGCRIRIRKRSLLT